MEVESGNVPVNEVDMSKDEMGGEPRLTTLAHGGG